MESKKLNSVVTATITGGLIWTLILSALKFAHVVDWSWWLIILPFVIPVLLVFAAVIYVMFNLKGPQD